MLKKLHLVNFKSVASASLDLGAFTFLVGRNGSGKSNVADALAFLCDAVQWPLQMVFGRRGGHSNVARRTPIDISRPTPAAPVELGLGVEFDGLIGWDELFNKSRVNVRYAFLVSVTRAEFEVKREQCVITPETGKPIWFDRSGRKVRSSVDYLDETGLSLASPDALVIPLVGSTPYFATAADAMKSMGVYSIEPGKLREFQEPDAGSRLLPDGSNAASILRGMMENPESSRRLFEILATVVPDLHRVRPATVGRKQLLRFYQQWSENRRLTFEAYSMSDGTLRAFGILLALFQKAAPHVVVIEEPETSLHPAAAAAIIGALRNASDRTQIIVSTHSPEILDMADAVEDEFRVVTWKKGLTSIGSVEGAAKESLRSHLASAGELFRMRILDAPPLFEHNMNDGQLPLFAQIP